MMRRILKVRPRPLRFFEFALICGWVILALAGAGATVVAGALGGVEDMVVVLILMALCGWMLAYGLRELPMAWRDVRACLVVGSDGVQVDRRGEQRYAWEEIAGFSADDGRPDPLLDAVTVQATMHLHDGREILLPGIELILGGEGAFTRRRVTTIHTQVATLNRLCAEAAQRRGTGAAHPDGRRG